MITEFACLNNQDVLAAQVSDHHPLVHDGVLFWNIMMQGNQRSNGQGFNNGFGIIEKEHQYMMRLIQVALVLAELVYKDPSIEVIGLCEGPIDPKHEELLLTTLGLFPFMKRFLQTNTFHKPRQQGSNWGLLMLADAGFSVSKISFENLAEHPKLTNRFQLWKLRHGESDRYIALAHFPFGSDEEKTEQKSLTPSGQKYCALVNTLLQVYNEEHFILCADFNFNPYLINKWQNRSMDQVTPNNSILLSHDLMSQKPNIKQVTVDGILLSAKEKQKYQSLLPVKGLVSVLASEYRFFRSNVRQNADLIKSQLDPADDPGSSPGAGRRDLN